MRQIALDTETTGLEPAQGHRIISALISTRFHFDFLLSKVVVFTVFLFFLVCSETDGHTYS